MVIDFQRVKDVHLAEKSDTGLTKIESDFYEQLRSFIEEEREKLRQKMEASGVGLDPENLFTYRNLIILAKQIIAMRAEKIVRMAVADAFTGKDSILDNAVDWERELYWDVRRKVEAVISRVVGEGGGSAFNLVHVRILTDIPVFVGPDLREYGPFRAGEEVPLPKEVADVLVKKGQAEVIR
ncbi:MAG: DNA replication complex GINS family protein [Candidatus Diapherotrites archaeon]|nr:DNA replication complex GINS family protein [Candidatus Diapherotrites archaeon]